MPPVFGRSLINPHPYDAAIADWLSSAQIAPRSMARNLMYDSRVTEVREQSFDTFTGHPTAPGALKEAIEYYLDVKVRYSRRPDYLDDTLNGDNFLSPTSSGGLLVSRRVHLARLVDLNGLEPVFLWAKEKQFREFADFPQDPVRISGWLDERFEAGLTPNAVKFIEVILQVMNAHRRESVFQPTWATTWNAFESFVAGGPERWLEVLGMHKPFPSRWIMILRYTVHEAGRIVRPTQLDAGWAPYHFPSLPTTNGHSMDLQIPPSAATPLPEFIHEQIDHTMGHWIQAGGLCQRTESINTEDLNKQRCAHHRLLINTYGESRICPWMPLCSDICSSMCT